MVQSPSSSYINPKPMEELREHVLAAGSDVISTHSHLQLADRGGLLGVSCLIFLLMRPCLQYARF